jgi:hypothetical protein
LALRRNPMPLHVFGQIWLVSGSGLLAKMPEFEQIESALPDLHVDLNLIV